MKKFICTAGICALSFIVFCSSQVKLQNYIDDNRQFNFSKKSIQLPKGNEINIQGCHVVLHPGLLKDGYLQVMSTIVSNDNDNNFHYYNNFFNNCPVAKFMKLLTATSCAQSGVIAYYKTMQENMAKNTCAKIQPQAVGIFKKSTMMLKGGYVSYLWFDKDDNCQIIYKVPLTGITEEKQKAINPEKIMSCYALEDTTPQYEYNFFYTALLNNRIITKGFGCPGYHTNIKSRQRSSREAANLHAAHNIIKFLMGETITVPNGESRANGMLENGDELDFIHDDKQVCQMIMQYKIQ